MTPEQTTFEPSLYTVIYTDKNGTEYILLLTDSMFEAALHLAQENPHEIKKP
jgi:hypothetical protein